MELCSTERAKERDSEELQEAIKKKYDELETYRDRQWGFVTVGFTTNVFVVKRCEATCVKKTK